MRKQIRQQNYFASGHVTGGSPYSFVHSANLSHWKVAGISRTFPITGRPFGPGGYGWVGRLPGLTR